MGWEKEKEKKRVYLLVPFSSRIDLKLWKYTWKKKHRKHRQKLPENDIGRMIKRGTPPQKVDIKGDTTFRRPRGFLCTCGRWHQSNDPAGCVRFHGTLFFIYSPLLLYQNSQAPNGLWYKHSSLRKAKRICTGNISDLRTPSVCFIQEEPHSIPCISNRGGIQSYWSLSCGHA